MLSSTSVLKVKPRFIPKVLFQIKKEAEMKTSKKVMTRDKGPWDRGHWANRK